MAARTRLAIATLTCFLPLITRDTVMLPTPHSRATSAIVGADLRAFGIKTYFSSRRNRLKIPGQPRLQRAGMIMVSLSFLVKMPSSLCNTGHYLKHRMTLITLRETFLQVHAGSNFLLTSIISV